MVPAAPAANEWFFPGQRTHTAPAPASPPWRLAQGAVHLALLRRRLGVGRSPHGAADRRRRVVALLLLPLRLLAHRAFRRHADALTDRILPFVNHGNLNERRVVTTLRRGGASAVPW